MGDKKGTKEVFAELPGMADTIRMSDYETLLVPFVLARRKEQPTIFDLVGEYPLIRSFLCSVSIFQKKALLCIVSSI